MGQVGEPWHGQRRKVARCRLRKGKAKRRRRLELLSNCSRVELLQAPRKKCGRVLNFYGRRKVWKGEVSRLPLPLALCLIPQQPAGRLGIRSLYCSTRTSDFL